MPCRVGGCLAAHWETREFWGADAWVVQVLRLGYRLPFVSRPRLSPVPLPLPSYSPNSVWGIALSAAVQDLRSKDAIEPASPDPGFYSRLFMAPKVTGSWCPVIDLLCLNRFVRLSQFRMETSVSVLQSLRPGDCMVSLDLQVAYLQVPVHPDSRRFLRFCIGSKVFQFKALCSGLSSAPQVFTRVMAPVSSIMHRFGFRILRYLDDWLFLRSSFQEISRARDFLLWLCEQLGILVNHSKSTLTPSQRIICLGMTLQSRPLRAFPTHARVQKVLAASTNSDPLGSSRWLFGFLFWGSCHLSPRLSQAPHAVSPTPPAFCGSSSVRGRADFLGRLLPPGSLVVVRRRSSGGRGPS